MALRRVTLADLAPSSNVTDIILRGGQAQADAVLRGGDAWANAIGGVTKTVTSGLEQFGAAKDEADVQKAVAASRTARGPADIESVLAGLPPELQPRAREGIQKIQLAGAAVQEHNLQIEKLKTELADAETKRKTVAADYGAGLGKQISQWIPSADGGLSAAAFGFAHAKELGTQGLEEIQPVLEGLTREWEAAQASGDPVAIQAAAEKNRQAIGPLAQRMTMGGSPEWQEKNRPKGVSLRPGGRLVNEQTGAVMADVPAEPKAAKKYEVTVPGPDGRPVKKLVSEEELAAGVPQYVEPKDPKDPKTVQIETVGPDGKPVTQFVTPTPGATFPKPTGQGKPATGQQRKALSYFNRAKEALESVESIEGNVAKYGLVNQGRLAAGGTVGNFIKNDEQQSYRQAQRAFTEARLRKESGATIKDSEYDNDAKTYFAVPGDSAATIEQKAAMRKAVLAGIAFEAGDALKEYYGDEAGPLLSGLKEASAAAGGAGKGDPLSVVAPDGKTYRFKSRTEADVFKKRAGIK